MGEDREGWQWRIQGVRACSCLPPHTPTPTLALQDKASINQSPNRTNKGNIFWWFGREGGGVGDGVQREGADGVVPPPPQRASHGRDKNKSVPTQGEQL